MISERKSSVRGWTLAVPVGLLICMAGLNCMDQPTGHTGVGIGSATVEIDVGRIGAAAKIVQANDIEMAFLVLQLTAVGETPILDTISLSGHHRQSVKSTYENLSAPKPWALLAISLDTLGRIIHKGTVEFQTTPGKNTIVTLVLKAGFSMLKADFYPICDSATRCELVVNGKRKDALAFPKGSKIGDTVSLSFDYLSTNKQHRVGLRVYGDMWGVDTLLYTGDTTITPKPGEDQNYVVVLTWVGPDTPPPGQATVKGVLGQIGTVTVKGEIKDDDASPGCWTTYTTRHGLPENSLGDLAADKAGNVWCATRMGLVKFNGADVKVYTTKDGLRSNAIDAVLVDKKGHIWVGHYLGVDQLNGSSWIRHNPGFSHSGVVSLVEDLKGNIWAGASGGGASRYDGSSWRVYSTVRGTDKGPATDLVRNMAVDSTGAVWFMTGTGASRFDGTLWTGVSARNHGALGVAGDKKAYCLSGFGVGDVTVSQSGEIWISVSSSNGSCLDRITIINGEITCENRLFRNLTGMDGRINALHTDSKGNLWVGANQGIARYDGANWETFVPSDSITFQNKHITTKCWVKDIAEDANGNLWFSTVKGGLLRYSCQGTSNPPEEDPECINPIAPNHPDNPKFIEFSPQFQEKEKCSMEGHFCSKPMKDITTGIKFGIVSDKKVRGKALTMAHWRYLHFGSNLTHGYINAGYGRVALGLRVSLTCELKRHCKKLWMELPYNRTRTTNGPTAHAVYRFASGDPTILDDPAAERSHEKKWQYLHEATIDTNQKVFRVELDFTQHPMKWPELIVLSWHRSGYASDPYEPNDHFRIATPIKAGDSLGGANTETCCIHAGDFFVFQGKEGQNVTFELPDHNGYPSIVDRAQNVIASHRGQYNMSTNRSPFRLQARIPTDGEYYLIVNPPSWRPAQNKKYYVKMEVETAP